MFSIVKYGNGRQLQLEHVDDATVVECGVPQLPPIADVRRAAAAALAEPLDYPPLHSAIMPADQVVLALGPDVPRAEEIVAAVVGALLDWGIAPDCIRLLATEAHYARSVLAAVPADVRSLVGLVVHAPDDRNALAYLTVTEDGLPVFLNRALVDADVVIPIGCVASHVSTRYHGIHAALYPTFADTRSQVRFRSPRVLEPKSPLRKKLVRLANEVGWLLGVSFTLQVVPGGGDDVLAVIAGRFDCVRRRGRELYQQAWRQEIAGSAPLVVAAICGGAEQQTWDRFGRSVAAASALVDEGGVLAVCSEIASALGPGLTALAAGRSRHETLKTIASQRPSDALPAAELIAALDRCEVYLYSRMEPEQVEQLEIAPLAAPEELNRLVRQFPSWILLANAAQAVVRQSRDG